MSGDFCTPAPLLQALGIPQRYDPAAGSGGFLPQACELLSDRPVLSNPPFALQQGHWSEAAA